MLAYALKMPKSLSLINILAPNSNMFALNCEQDKRSHHDCLHEWQINPILSLKQIGVLLRVQKLGKPPSFWYGEVHLFTSIELFLPIFQAKFSHFCPFLAKFGCPLKWSSVCTSPGISMMSTLLPTSDPKLFPTRFQELL